MPDNDEPMNLIIDATTGDETWEPLTAEEVVDAEARAAEQAVLNATAEQQDASRQRLAELKAKGWASLTAAERTEAQALMLELT